MKNLLLLPAMLLITALVHSQLYVTPNGTTDSYVYVNDEILYVEDDVNLVENNAGTTQASIYLRERAQLIQGSGSTANSGTGYISVFQDSHADAYDYNFWSSPVGVPSSTGNRNFGILRVYDSINNYTNSTVTTTTSAFNGVSSPLDISRRWLYINAASYGGWFRINEGEDVPPGYGFTMKGTDVTVHADPINEPQNQLYDFRGRPHNGNIAVEALNATATIAGKKEQLRFISFFKH